ncbi:Ig-like domain-containing protein [Crocosphaera sp. XPORK-15E]|nr:Ig-like domain-containing protein [Crocosphaera sp. XPORK-15E]MEA5532934.1 Ig-like domain-containing protein [Crocosphaera sp. XPORK-15E]
MGVPTVEILNAPATVDTLEAFPVTFQFSEDVTGFVLADILVTNGTASNFVAVDGNTYTANITPNGNGTVTINVPEGAAIDADGNESLAATPVTTTLEPPLGSPVVDIQNAPDAVNSTTPFSVTFQFSEDVTGFVLADILVTNGTASNFVAVDGNTYTADITPGGNGIIIIDVPAGAAVDADGTESLAATPATTIVELPPTPGAGVPIDDTLTGTAGNDSIRGSSGNDSISGLAGEDTLRGARGRDFIQGEEGNDTVRGGNAKDTLTGGMGNDLIVGGKGDDSISGDEGNDSIQGAENRDIITGGEGNDTIRGGNAIDNLDGGLGDDSIIGGKGNDTLLGRSGNDTLEGRAGKDLLVGGSGSDVLQGGNGQDTLIGGQQTPNDFERDTLTGGNGLDTFVLQTTDANANADVITDFVAGTDKFGLTGGLTFTDLTVAGVGANVTITNNNTGFLLAIVENAALADVNNAANFETFVF